jgi:hypothetical protein
LPVCSNTESEPARPYRPSLAVFHSALTSTQNPADTAAPASSQEPATPVELKHRIPHTHQPQSGDAQPACPAGNGKPCALLGGRLYFADPLALARHNKSWLDAARSPGMVLSLGLLTTATIADIQTTHTIACAPARMKKGARQRNPCGINRF